jgi:hypothetical protein
MTWPELVELVRTEMKEHNVKKLSVKRIGSVYQFHVAMERGESPTENGVVGDAIATEELPAPLEG